MQGLFTGYMLPYIHLWQLLLGCFTKGKSDPTFHNYSYLVVLLKGGGGFQSELQQKVENQITINFKFEE